MRDEVLMIKLEKALKTPKYWIGCNSSEAERLIVRLEREGLKIVRANENT